MSSGSPASEKHTLRTVFIITTAATLFGSLLVPPVQDFLGAAWRVMKVIGGAILHVFTAPVPVWVLLVVVAVVALLVARRVGRRAPPVMEVYDGATGMGPPPAALPRLNELEDGVLRRLARADGELLAIDELGTAKTKQLRLEQALEHLGALGLVAESESDTSEPLYGLTSRGRDLVIARGDV
jgi:hypothetical protein